jgi:hypothetical protein
MQSVTPPRLVQRVPLGLLLTDTIIGTLLIVGGVTIGVLIVATPLLTMIMPSGRLGPDGMAAGIVILAVALVAPAGAILLGTNRLIRILGIVRRRLPGRSPLQIAMGTLPEGATALSGVTLSDNRPVADLVLGPFGAAVIRELPPAGITRIRDGQWELRTKRGWVSLENPLDRAVRDAERVRRWFAADDADFVVKVYAAVTGPAPTIERTTACAVVSHDQLASWVTGLAPQRSLTAGRQDRMLALARSAAGLDG